jgi:protein-disulfide isomerase
MRVTKPIQFYLECAASLATVATAIAVLWVAVLNKPQQSSAAAPTRGWEWVTGLETTVSSSAKNVEAKIALGEFSDYHCPYSNRYATDAFPQIQRTFIETGLVAYVFRNCPLEAIHPHALQAAAIAECAGEQGQFWRVRERLFVFRQTVADTDVDRWASQFRLDPRRLRQCIGENGTARVRADQAEGKRLGVKSTPTFMVGRLHPTGQISILQRISGAQPYEVFRSALHSLLNAVP